MQASMSAQVGLCYPDSDELFNSEFIILIPEGGLAAFVTFRVIVA